MRLRMLLAYLLTILAFMGCSSRGKAVRVSAGAATGSAEPSLRGPEFSVAEGLRQAFFPLDDAGLGPAAREILKANAAVMKSSSDTEFLIEGHCDERGTTEYNLALGQKRAKAVRDYYMMLGVQAGRVATRSYGEEAPSCADPTESCWAANRRAETKARKVPRARAAGRK